jgi:hypothetical protein
MRIQKTLVIAAVAAAGIAGAAVAVADVTTTQSQPSADAAAASAASMPTPGSFGVFRRAARSGDVMPVAVRTMLTPTAEREGLDLDRARAAATVGVSRVWVIPGPGKVCLALPDPVDGFGVTCRTPKEAAAGELMASLVGLPGQRAGDAHVAFFAPDGASRLTTVAKDGRYGSLDVSDNVAVGDLSDAGEIQFTDASGVDHAADVPGTPAALVAGA